MRRRKEAASSLAPAPARKQPSNVRLSPAPHAILVSLLVVRLIGAYSSPIPDCDEVMNYWEQTHYLLHGTGLQTWEYSPEYAIRSYFYCAVHALVARVASVLLGDGNKVAIFYCVRFTLGAASAVCEARFVQAVVLACGSDVATLTWLLLASSAGMFHAAVAFLPSSFAMVLLTCAWTCWLGAEGAKGKGLDPSKWYAGAIWAVAAATLLGWPFAGIIGAGPLAIAALMALGVLPFLRHALAALVSLVVPSALLDSYLYGRPVLAFLNILLYNSSAKQGAGAQLYGVEPWHYYLHNLALNFNAALPAALAAPALLVVAHVVMGGREAPRRDGSSASASPTLPVGRLLLVLSALYLWIGFFSLIPHKEERFIFPVYPLLCLAAALAISHGAQLLCACVPRRMAFSHDGARRVHRFVVTAAITLSATLSTMRAAGQVTYFGAPLRLYGELAAELARAPAPAGSARPSPMPAPLSVCTGNEWYRFPSSFFLPAGVTLSFVRDGFRGQLPAPYASPWPDGSRLVPKHFNGLNLEEPSRYIPMERCDVLVDLLPIAGSDDASSRAALQRGLVIWRTARFLDAARSPAWSRALYVPWLSERRNAYAQYALLLTPKGVEALKARGVRGL